MELILFGLLGVLLVFMIFNTRRRNKQMKEQQAEKASKTIPGVKVMLQGGFYGTIVAYDAENLDEPALVEIAPGTIVEVHSQAILRIVEPTDADDEAVDDADDDADDAVDEDDLTVDEEIPAPDETPEETRARLERDSDSK